MADEHPLLRVAVTRALNEEEGFEVVGEAALCDPLLAIARSAKPDVVLFVRRSTRDDDLACLSRLRACCPGVMAILCSPLADLDHIERAFQLGACGFLATADPADLAAGVRRVVEGTTYRASGTSAIDQDACRARGD